MNKKSVFLSLALILPISIFVFLKLTGKNQFDIPVYFSNGAHSLSSICGRDYSKPYSVSDSILVKIGWEARNATVIAFGETNNLEIKRLADQFDKNAYSLLTINSRNTSENVAVAKEVFTRWRNCEFIINENKNVVLIDKQKRIRGYYTIGSREEMDRLIVEMKILLKEY